MIEDALAQAASRAIAWYITEHAASPRPPRHPRGGLGADLAPRNSERGPANQQPHESRGLPIRPLAVAPPRRSPFAPLILAEAIQPRIKIPNLSEYNGVGDPQDHLDQFLVKADLLDISDATYCKLFRSTLSGKALAWFNQLPPRTVEVFEQLSQRFLHHFAINKQYPKTASYLFTIVQREHEGLREYIQRIEETADTRPMTPMKTRSTEEEEVMPPKVERGRRECKHMPPNNLAHYTPLSVPRAEILAIAKQQGLVRRPLPMQDNPKRMKSDRF
ncbi:UNVERIFIED_CONTAM: hypothetical protein Scaly_2687700 [Sesamum calycinum]|uniref:Retrotransposon gag domain-containing protein n=1 Tax=Sesamum calycinum TaxID=2727403 RepID=A0AAW2J6Q8_9LAMI